VLTEEEESDPCVLGVESQSKTELDSCFLQLNLSLCFAV
jgi:hypothetical protein